MQNINSQTKSKMVWAQTFEVKRALNMIGFNYYLLTQKRYDGTLTRDEQFIYELMDGLLAMEAIYQEVANGYIRADYINEKLDFMQRYIDAAKRHFNTKSKE